MRKLSILALFVSAASLASAATISIACVPSNLSSINAGVITTPTFATCAAQAASSFGSNLQFTNLSLSFIGSFSDSNPNNGMKQVTFTGSSIYGNFVQATNSSQFNGTTGLVTPLNASTPLSTAIAAFNVNIATTTGVNIPDSAQYTVFANYTYETIPTTGDVPEPSTIALVGGVLVLAGLRKFRS